MGKKCLICEGPAQYTIKDTSDFYCAECAEEQFGDVELLVKLNADAHVKNNYKEKIEEKYEYDLE